MSRGSLVQLVSAALGECGRWPERPPGQTPVIGSAGRYDGLPGENAPVDAETNPLTMSPDGLLLPNGSSGTVIPRVLQEEE